MYDRTVDEQIEELAVTCGTHGNLGPDDLSVGSDGQLHCQYCSINQEMDVDNQSDIDSSVTVDFAHRKSEDSSVSPTNGDS